MIVTCGWRDLSSFTFAVSSLSVDHDVAAIEGNQKTRGIQIAVIYG